MEFVIWFAIKGYSENLKVIDTHFYQIFGVYWYYSTWMGANVNSQNAEKKTGKERNKSQRRTRRRKLYTYVCSCKTETVLFPQRENSSYLHSYNTEKWYKCNFMLPNKIQVCACDSSRFV